MLLFLFGLIVLVVCVSDAQWPSVEVAQTRFTGVCGEAGQFDCGVLGENRCIPIKNFHDGKPNCPDSSDEFCFPGQIRCGNFCANLEHLVDCISMPYCADELGIKSLFSPQEASFCSFLKRKLCLLPNAVPCKGYGECVLRKWLLDGKSDCFDASDEEFQYANLFKFSEEANHHILPHIISTGSSVGSLPLGIPALLPGQPATFPDTQHLAATPVPITVPPSQTFLPLDTTTSTFHPSKPTLHTQPATSHPLRSTSDRTSSTLYPHQPTTPCPQQPVLTSNYTGFATLHSNQSTTTSLATTSQPNATKSAQTLWPIGRTIFETTKVYGDKLDEFSETYGPAVRPWHSALSTTPSLKDEYSSTLAVSPTSVTIKKQVFNPTKVEWEVYPPEQPEGVEPAGFTTELPASSGVGLQKPWWLQPKSITLMSTLYPGQKIGEYAKLPNESDSPFVVPGGGIFVWPNGVVNGPWLTKSTSMPMSTPTSTATHTHTPLVPLTTTVSLLKATVAPTTTSSTSPTNFEQTHSTPTISTSRTQAIQPSSGIWVIDPGQQIPQPASHLGHSISATPVLVPPTYMPVVSTYPPQETSALGSSTVLPIYPDEIGHNVKFTTISRKQEIGYKTTNPVGSVTDPSVQSSIGNYEGGKEKVEVMETTKESTSIMSSTTTVPPTKASASYNATVGATTVAKDFTATYRLEQSTKALVTGLAPKIDGYSTTGDRVKATAADLVTNVWKNPREDSIETTTMVPLNLSKLPNLQPTRPPQKLAEPQFPWAPAVSAGLIFAQLNQANQQELSCKDRLRLAAEKLVIEPECKCGVGEMLTSKNKCERAPLATFRVKLTKWCGNKPSRDDERLTASLVILKVTNTGIEAVCVRKSEVSAFVLNAICSTPNCSAKDVQQSVSSTYVTTANQRNDLANIEIEVEELKNGACGSSRLNDCTPWSTCKLVKLHYRCYCSSTNTYSKGNGSDCPNSADCIRIAGICLLIWIALLLLPFCLLLFICCFVCYRWKYLENSRIWTKVRKLGLFRSERQDLESGGTGTGSPTQKHNEGLPRPPDAPNFSIAKLPEAPSQTTTQHKAQNDSVLDYYNVNNDSEVETDTASHGLVSLVSTDQSRIDTTEEGGAELTSKSAVPVEVHRSSSAASKARVDAKADNDEKLSATSRSGTPTIWEKFQILGNQYAQVSEKLPSETNSLDSLLACYQDKEFAKLKEREPELFQVVEAPAVPESKYLPRSASSLHLVHGDISELTKVTAGLPYFAHTPPTPQQQDRSFSSRQLDQNVQKQEVAESPIEEEESTATPLPIEDAIAFAEQLNQEYKQRREERRLKHEAEFSSPVGDDSSIASTIPFTPNSNEMFHSSLINNSFDYEESELIEVDTKPVYNARNRSRAATSDQLRLGNKASRARTTNIQSADASSTINDASALAKSLVSSHCSLPAHLRLKIPVKSEAAAVEKHQSTALKFQKSIKKSVVDLKRGQQLYKPKEVRAQPKREPRPTVSATMRQQSSKTSSLRSNFQKPPRPPVKAPLFGDTLSKKPPNQRSGASSVGQSRSSTMSSNQKQQALESSRNGRATASMPNSERHAHLKSDSLSMGCLRSPKRSPSLPSIISNAKPKLSLNNANFMIADIDLDLPGPYMIPATLDDIKSGRLAEIISGSSKDPYRAVDETSAISRDKAAINKRPVTHENTNSDLKDSNQYPLVGGNRKLLQRKSWSSLSSNFVPEATKAGLTDSPRGSTTSDSGQKAFLDASRKLSNLEERVHENCLTDRPPWDDTPLKDGDLEKIPLDFNLPRSYSFTSIMVTRRRSCSFNIGDRTSGALSARLSQQARQSKTCPLSVRSSVQPDSTDMNQKKQSKQIGKMPMNVEQRRQWVEELKTSLNSKNWLEYD